VIDLMAVVAGVEPRSNRPVPRERQPTRALLPSDHRPPACSPPISTRIGYTHKCRRPLRADTCTVQTGSRMDPPEPVPRSPPGSLHRLTIRTRPRCRTCRPRIQHRYVVCQAGCASRWSAVLTLSQASDPGSRPRHRSTTPRAGLSKAEPSRRKPRCQRRPGRNAPRMLV
jgi:hypothetical protein